MILGNGLQMDLLQIFYHTDTDVILTMGLTWIYTNSQNILNSSFHVKYYTTGKV